MRPNFLIILFILAGFTTQAQVPEKWQASIPGTILWQHVTPVGNYLVGTSQGLTSIDQETGNVIWTSPAHPNLSQDQIEQNGPLITVHHSDFVEMLNPFNGKVLFNSRKAGISEVVDSYYLPQSNGLLISGMVSGEKQLMVFADLNTGEVKWKIDDDYGRLVHASELSSQQALVVTLWSNYRVDLSSGSIIWKSSTSKTELNGALGKFMKNIATQAANQMDINIAFYRHPEKEIFYIASQQEQTSGFTSSTSTNTVSFVTEYHAFDLNSGEILWDEPLQVQGAISHLYFHQDGLLIMPDDGANTTVNLYDDTNKEGKWGKKGRGVRVKGGIYDYIPSGNGLVLVSSNGGKNFLSYLDTDQGLLTFDKPVKVDGEVLYTEQTSKGIIYVTSEEMNILNPSTGELIFPKSIQTNSNLIAHDGNDLYVYDIREAHLKKFNKETADIRIASPAIEFEGKEIPRFVERRNDGIFLHSDQNVALVNFDGDKVFQKYYAAPKEPGLKRALLYAEAVRAAYISANAYAASSQLQSVSARAHAQDPAAGALVDGMGQMYGQLGDAASDFAKQSWSQANARFKATSNARDFMVVLTELEKKNNALVVVSKSTGEILSFISLGTERLPDYAMDDITGKVFYRTSSNTIAGYNLQ